MLSETSVPPGLQMGAKVSSRGTFRCDFRFCGGAGGGLVSIWRDWVFDNVFLSMLFFFPIDVVSQGWSLGVFLRDWVYHL